MPYITDQARKIIVTDLFERLFRNFKNREKSIDLVHLFDAGYTPGELNYIISSICHAHIKRKGLSYITINSMIGVLECVKQELYRKIAGPYESQKRLENGGISSLDSKSLEDVR